jgi:hypothetical protein
MDPVNMLEPARMKPGRRAVERAQAARALCQRAISLHVRVMEEIVMRWPGSLAWMAAVRFSRRAPLGRT